MLGSLSAATRVREALSCARTGPAATIHATTRAHAIVCSFVFRPMVSPCESTHRRLVPSSRENSPMTQNFGRRGNYQFW
jgi:hypothetical protein